MRSILRFVFVVVPTAALASAVVIGVSRNDQGVAATSDGDLQRDLKLASSTTLELAPLGQPLATVSSIEAPPAATPERSVRPKRSSSGPRAVRSRARVVRAAPEPEVAESTEESQTTEVAELAGASAEATTVAPAEGGVALPRPTAIPVSYPGTGEGDGSRGTDTDGGWGGIGTVIRGGGVDGDHCQIHGRGGRIYGPPIYRQPRGISLGDRVRAAQPSGQARRSSLGDRVRTAQGRSGSQGSSRGGSLGDRLRAARGR
ncbi:MAG: hypothetical protein M3282_06585 [Gemmatimonadota bacterium]|nr:hypothetical protein [Gemmatimonadota bacterium]